MRRGRTGRRSVDVRTEPGPRASDEGRGKEASPTSHDLGSAPTFDFELTCLFRRRSLLILPSHADLKNPAKEAVARKPISGRLSLSLKAARDLEHAPLPSSRSSKYFNETTVEFKIHGNVKDVSHPSRTDRWMQDFDIEMDKADEVEIAFYDQQGGQKNPPPRVLIGVMWLKVSDLLEALRRQKVEGMDGEGAGWVTAATVRGQDGSSSSGGGGGRRNGDVDAPLGQHGSMTLGGHGGASSAGHGGPSDGLDGWFNVEPQGAVNFHLDFGKSSCI